MIIIYSNFDDLGGKPSLIMASQDSNRATNVIKCLQDLLSYLPEIFAEFDRNLLNTDNEDILQCMERRAYKLCFILSAIHADMVGLNVQGDLHQIFGILTLHLRRLLYWHTNIDDNGEEERYLGHNSKVVTSREERWFYFFPKAGRS